MPSLYSETKTFHLPCACYVPSSDFAAAVFATLQAAFNKIPSGGPLLPLLNGALVLGAVGYCGYNSVFTGEGCPVVVACLAGGGDYLAGGYTNSGGSKYFG